MDAERIIEWITHVMAIELTTHQENMIRLHCDGGDMSYRSYARGGYKFAEVMARACREAEERAQQDTVRQMLKGNPVDEAIYDEAALIPDHVFLADTKEEQMDHDEMPAVRSMVDVFGVLKYFAWEHLPAHLQEVSRPFYVIALDVAERWVDGADEDETNMALRKLLEAKDAAVRAVV